METLSRSCSLAATLRSVHNSMAEGSQASSKSQPWWFRALEVHLRVIFAYPVTLCWPVTRRGERFSGVPTLEPALESTKNLPSVLIGRSRALQGLAECTGVRGRRLPSPIAFRPRPQCSKPRPLGGHGCPDFSRTSSASACAGRPHPSSAKALSSCPSSLSGLGSLPSKLSTARPPFQLLHGLGRELCRTAASAEATPL